MSASTKDTTKGASSDAPVSTSSDLANTRDYLPTLSENDRAALRAWSDYAEMLELPFVPKTDAAAQGVRFSIIRLGERTTESLNKPGTFEDQWVVAVVFEEDCTLQPRDPKSEALAFSAGERALITTSKGGIRDNTANVIADIIARFGMLPGMRLVQLEPKTKGQSGPIIFKAAFDVAG